VTQVTGGGARVRYLESGVPDQGPEPMSTQPLKLARTFAFAAATLAALTVFALGSVAGSHGAVPRSQPGIAAPA
jgi:hypothetical protein